jgi:hypothetical protein
MEFYSFNINSEETLGYQELYDHHFSGALFQYSTYLGDFFTKIAKYANKEHELKYIVAIRPYTISAQYLCMIGNTLDKIIPNQLQINFVTGWPYEEEKTFGGILGEVNDLSSRIDRSNYLIKYIDSLNEIKTKIPDYYVSVTNNFLYDVADKHRSKMIIPYSYFKSNRFNLLNKDVMVSVAPILRQSTEEIKNLNDIKTEQDMDIFSYKEFVNLIELLKENNINKILIRSTNAQEKKNVFDFVKKYKEGYFDSNI